MRQRIAAVLVGLCLMLALPVQADVGASMVVLGPGHTTSPSCASGTCDGTADSTTGTVNVSNVTYIRVQFYCTTGPCTSVMTVNTRSRVQSAAGTAPPWIPLISCTNVTTAGVCSDGSIGYVNIPVTMQFQIVQSGTGGGTSAAILETHTVTP